MTAKRTSAPGTSALMGAILSCYGAYFGASLAFQAYLHWFPLIVIAVVLSIVAIAQQRVAAGVAMLLVTTIGVPAMVVVPLLFSGYRIVIQPAEDSSASREAVVTTRVSPPSFEDLYIRNVAVSDVTWVDCDDCIGLTSGLAFKLRNGGDRTLDHVTVTAYFKNACGAILSLHEFVPVQASGYVGQAKAREFADEFPFPSRPLKPGEVWQPEAGRFLRVSTPSLEWEKGNVEVLVTAVRFAKES